MARQPSLRPRNPRFGSGPARKPVKNSFESDPEILGVSHRSVCGLRLIQKTLSQLRCVLEIPSSHELAFIGGGGTGAMEFLLWNLLGAAPTDVFTNGVFGDHWLRDIQYELNVKPLRSFIFKPGESVDFSQAHPEHDIVFVWTETPSGTSVAASSSCLSSSRTGLTVCDAVASVFCESLPWNKLDAVAFSFQKGLGGEAGLGAVALGPRARERLQTHAPSWAVPRLFRVPFLDRDGQRKIPDTFWQGHTINTVSLAAMQDISCALAWADEQGGLPGLLQRVQANDALVTDWVHRTKGFHFLAENPESRARQVACIEVEDPQTHQRADWPFLRRMAALLGQESVAWDCLNHSLSVPCLRLWLGPVVDTPDVAALLPWLEWAREKVAEA